MARTHIRSLRSAALAVVAVGAVAAAVPMTLAAHWAPLKPLPVERRPTTSMTDCGGRPLHSAIVRPGQCVAFVGRNFKGHELVEVRRRNTKQVVRAAADAAGAVRYQIVLAPSTPTGADVITMVGLGTTSAAASTATANAAAATANLEVTVPRFAVLNFSVSRH
ncbi:hypothetical protein ACSMXN_03845 [Jatrophihabitans sp. DSM 45814]